MVSIAVSKIGMTALIFVVPGMKVNGQYYRDVLLSQQMLPAITHVASDTFVFQQDIDLSDYWVTQSHAETGIHKISQKTSSKQSQKQKQKCQKCFGDNEIKKHNKTAFKSFMDI